MEPIHLLVADDHKLFRKSLIQLIGGFNLSFVFYEASDGVEVLNILASHRIDVVLLDIQMPVLNGIQVLKKIRQEKSDVKVIVLTQFEEESLAAHLLQLGANAFVYKRCEPAELEQAIRVVLKDGHYYNEAVLNALKLSITNAGHQINFEISPREFQVMSLLHDGKSNKDIAHVLGLTLRTIESYRKALMKKTQTKNAAELVRFVYRTGMMT